MSKERGGEEKKEGKRKSRVRIGLRVNSQPLKEIDLEPGQKLLLGFHMARQLDPFFVHIPNPNLAAEQLSVFFEEDFLWVRDLNESLGTFRLPQNAPFLESRFSLPFELTLRVGSQTTLQLTGKNFSEPSQHEESLSSQDNQNSQKRWLQAFLWVTLASIFLMALSFAPVLMVQKNLKNFEKDYLDFLYLWQKFFLSSPFLIGFSLSLALTFFLSRFLKQKKQSFSFFLFCLLFFPLPFFAPVIVGEYLKKRPWTVLNAFQKIRNLTKSQARDSAVWARELGGYENLLKGSSYYYTQLLEVYTQRALEGCEGRGDKAWQEKRSCLILLHAAGIQALAQAQPALLEGVAERGAILLSLDGILRVLSVEGADSPYITYFFNSLVSVDLVAEAETIAAFFGTGEANVNQLIELLTRFREGTETAISLEMKRLRLPEELRPKFHSPLFYGI